MNRYEFMRQLEMLLADITPSERKEALQFYNDYFDDAGAENEQEVIKVLGSPEKVAETIKADLTGDATGEFTENGYKDFYNKGEEIIEYGQGVNGQKQENPYQNGTYQGGGFQNGQENTYQNTGNSRKGMSAGQIVLLVVLCICAAPILIPIAAVIFAVFVAIAAVLFALFISVAAIAFAMVVVGVVLLVVGIVKMFAAPFGGMCLAGTGLVCAGIGILFVILSVWVCAIAIPAIVRGIVNLCRLPFRKKRGAAA